MTEKPGNMVAVITADIVKYTSLTKRQSDRILDAIHALFREINRQETDTKLRYTIYRGDNIQVELSEPGDALKVALLLKSSINMTILNNNKDINKNRKPFLDIRISVGVGKSSIRRKAVSESSGDAYIFSGRTLDIMKRKKRLLSVQTYDKQYNRELDTECRLLETIMGGWRITSSEVIYWKLLGLYDKDISPKLNISEAAVSQRKKLAGWKGVEALLERYKEIIKILEK